MSTAVDNKYGVKCNGYTCTTPDGVTFTYDPNTSTVSGDGESYQVSQTPDGMSNPIFLGDIIPGVNGYVDIPED